MQWVPATATASQALAANAPTGITEQPRKKRRGVLAAVVAVTFALLTALAFLSVSDADTRMLFVNFCGAMAVIATAYLLVLVTVGAARGRRSKVWIGALLAVLALEVGMSGGLNAYADSFTVATTSVVQDYYAEVADAVSLGNAVAAGHAPAGVRFDTIHAQALSTETALAALDVPAGLSAYRSSVQSWAADVALDSGFGGNSWANVPSTPDPFDLTMTTDQADAAVATSARRIATLSTFSKRADAAQNVEGRRYIGARLDAQSYWLEAIYTSADPNWVQANLRFVEPIGYYKASPVIGDMTLAASTTRSWPAPRHWSNCNPRGFAACNIPNIQGPLRTIIRGSLAMQNTYSKSTPAMTTADTQLEAIPGIIDGSGGQPLTGAGAGKENINTPPPAFADKCKAQGGSFGGNIYDRTVSRVPTGEQGWTCQTPGNKCFDLLTYSGAEYRGGQPGCPEQGLIPARPISNIFRNGGGGTSPQGSPPASTPSVLTWDGTYTTTPSTASCHAHVPDPSGGPPYDATNSVTQPPTSFVVSNNNAPGGIPISPTGEATFSVPVPGMTTFTMTLTFVHDANGGAHFSGPISYSSPVGGGTITCSGSVSGTRN